MTRLRESARKKFRKNKISKIIEESREIFDVQVVFDEGLQTGIQCKQSKGR